MREKDLAKLEPTFRQIGGYINYEDYMFLLMMLTTPRRNFEIAFRMFDLDGNGVVDAQEFAQVTETIMRGKKVSDRLQNLVVISRLNLRYGCGKETYVEEKDVKYRNSILRRRYDFLELVSHN